MDSITPAVPWAPFPQATHRPTPFQSSSSHPQHDHPNPAQLRAVTARMHLPRRKGPAWGCRVGVLGWVGSSELWSLSLSLSPSPCHWQPGDVDLHGWVPAVPPPCSNRPFVFQIHWPPRPGQTEECFRKGKDPGVSLSPCGGSPCARWLPPCWGYCHLPGIVPWGSRDS